MLLSRRTADIAIERWVEVALRERHAAARLEPVPEALLKLLREDDRT